MTTHDITNWYDDEVHIKVWVNNWLISVEYGMRWGPALEDNKVIAPLLTKTIVNTSKEGQQVCSAQKDQFELSDIIKCFEIFEYFSKLAASCCPN